MRRCLWPIFSVYSMEPLIRELLFKPFWEALTTAGIEASKNFRPQLLYWSCLHSCSSGSWRFPYQDSWPREKFILPTLRTHTSRRISSPVSDSSPVNFLSQSYYTLSTSYWKFGWKDFALLWMVAGSWTSNSAPQQCLNLQIVLNRYWPATGQGYWEQAITYEDGKGCGNIISNQDASMVCAWLVHQACLMVIKQV